MYYLLEIILTIILTYIWFFSSLLPLTLFPIADFLLQILSLQIPHRICSCVNCHCIYPCAIGYCVCLCASAIISAFAKSTPVFIFAHSLLSFLICNSSDYHYTCPCADLSLHFCMIIPCLNLIAQLLLS